MEWNGIELNWMEWNGMEWNGIEWNWIVVQFELILKENLGNYETVTCEKETKLDIGN